MSNFAIEQVVTKYWVVQETEYKIHPNNTVTLMCIAYANKVDAKENNHANKIDQTEITLSLQGNEQINEVSYIDELATAMQGTKVSL